MPQSLTPGTTADFLARFYDFDDVVVLNMQLVFGYGRNGPGPYGVVTVQTMHQTWAGAWTAAYGRRSPERPGERSRLPADHVRRVSSEVVQYEDAYRLCYIRGPEGLLIGLSEQPEQIG